MHIVLNHRIDVDNLLEKTIPQGINSEMDFLLVQDKQDNLRQAR